MKLSDISPKEIPAFKEFTVAKLYEMCSSDPTIMVYLPDLEMSKKMPDREFCYNILHTLYPDFLDRIINHAYEARLND